MTISKRRVVVTGLGLVSPVGSNVQDSWQAMLDGRSGIVAISSFDTTAYPSKIAAEVSDFDPSAYISPKETRRMDRFVQFGVVAGAQAIADSGLEVDEQNAPRCGVYVGSGIGGILTIEATTELFLAKGVRKISPFYIPMTITNMISGNLSIMFGMKGPNLSMVTACSTGTHALGDAARLIEYGDVDVMVAGGAEAPISATSVGGFCAARALSTRDVPPEHASCPWDTARDGFVIGEGAGVMVLEEYEHARRRGARIYAELSGFGMSGDAHHITSPAPGGEGASRCMNNALKNAGRNPDAVDYINAHGTSTPLGDVAEVDALKASFGGGAKKLAISSNKSMIGHLLGAAGGVEAVMTVLSVYHDQIPPTINLHSPDPQCDLDFVPNTARDARVRVALSNSFGFGGTNGTLVFNEI